MGRKIDYQKVMASLNTTYPKCGRVIVPAEIRRVDFDTMICPECGERFEAVKRSKGQ